MPILSKWHEAIVVGALGNPFNIGQTVVITGILILTALAAAIPFYRPSLERRW